MSQARFLTIRNYHLLLVKAVLVWLTLAPNINAQVLPTSQELTICSGIATLAGIPAVSGNTYLWTDSPVISNIHSSMPTFTVINGAPIVLDFSFNLREYNSSGTLLQLIVFTFHVKPRLYSLQTILETDICTGDTVFIERQASWGSQITVTPQTYLAYSISDSLYTIRPLVSSQYHFSYMDTAACIERTKEVEIYMHPRPVAQLSSDLDVFCSNDTSGFQLNYGIDSTGVFTGTGVSQEGIFYPAFSFSGEQVISYTLSNAGCSASDSIIIYVYGENDVTMESLPNFCQSDDPLELDFAIPAGGNYYVDDVLVDSLYPSAISNGSHYLKYAISIGVGCNVEIERVFNIIPRPPIPNIDIAPDSIVCALDSVRLKCSFFSNYLWSTGETTETIYVTESGNYSVSTISNLGCKSLPKSASVLFVDSISGELESPLYDSGFPISTYNASDGQVNLSFEGGYAPFSILWSNGEADTNSISSLPKGEYHVTITDRSGCFFSDTIFLDEPNEIIIIEKTDFSLPNAFTPNADGFNDTYRINKLSPDYLQNKLLVWDISRRLVFSAENYDNTWSGLDNSGNKLPAGTYFAVFESPALAEPIKTFIDLRYE
jgi:gliding motility-associated-like protein